MFELKQNGQDDFFNLVLKTGPRLAVTYAAINKPTSQLF